MCFIPIGLSATIISIPSTYPTIQGGIDVAFDGDTVLVDQGTYLENINFNGKNITVGSMFLTTQDTSYISQTIIDADSSGSVVTFMGGENQDSKLVGFTITNGNGEDGRGGGINIYNASPYLSFLTIRNNYTESNGAGIKSYGNNQYFHDLNIENNISEGQGGAIYSYNSTVYLYNSKLNSNYASSGSAIWTNSNTFLHNVEIHQHNESSYIIFLEGGSMDCNNCNMHSNNGNLFFSDYAGTSIFKNSTIHNNTGDFLFNFYYFGGPKSFINTTITNNDFNRLMILNRSQSVNISNSIIYYNNGNIYLSSSDASEIAVSYSDIENGSDLIDDSFGTLNWLNGNIDIDPMFFNPDSSDYSLSENSPCIDAGDPTSELDPDGTISDMGAIYFNQFFNPCDNDYPEGDFNMDYIVNVLDVVILTSCILSDSGCDVCFDLNNDQEVDVIDIVSLVNIILNN